MTITTQAPPASADRVKGLLEAGHTVEQVATATGWPRQRIVALINGWKGWLHHHGRDVAYQPGSRPVRQAAAPTPTAPATAQPPAPKPAAPASASLSVATTAELITRAAGMDDKAVQRELTRVTEALARLRTAVAGVDARAEEDRKRQAAVEEIERLEAELADARARAKELGGKRTTKPSPAAAATGPTPKQVRAWAAENGVECNSHGRVPQGVVDQYLAANGDA